MSEQPKKVKVTVVYGSVATWKDGSFKLGDSFITEETEANKIDAKFVKIEPITPEAPAPQPIPEPTPEPTPTPEPEVKTKKAKVKIAEEKPAETPPTPA